MAEFPTSIFVDPIAAHRLTCQSVYRLQNLGARKFPWQEETLTEILLGHLTGVNYRIDARCPECEHEGSHRCRIWDSATMSDSTGGIRLLTRPQEGGNQALGRRGVGADFVYSLQDEAAECEIRMLIQAKRARCGQPIKSGAVPARQRVDLLEAAGHYGGAPYYLFYAESQSAHDGQNTRCRVHRSPPDTSMILVPAQVLTHVFDVDKATAVSATELFEQGRTLMCIDGCAKTAASLNAFDRLLRFIRDDNPDYQPVDAGRPLPEAPAVQILTKASKPPAKKMVRRVTRGGSRRVEHGEILWVYLGEWIPEIGSERTGHGWYPQIDPKCLSDSARMYWKLDLHRAQTVRYLVASAQGEIRALYRVKPDSLVVHHNYNHKVSFELEALDPDNGIYKQVRQRTETYLTQRKPRARNVVGYP
ncbi:hypothetical protein DFR70_103658 [Nocardia tenerifensis]|uniref:Uncharacterized protein n=1 Tax=Nocardia tenerifensis TaxID=228006 RepID=A0A318KIC4_9NOCA|nr:hypothetical protein [Nocardia tenerifensis]PXX66903.1 hypothetical protein DFR70_103658 [Nocardia tenerifensis]